MSIFEGIIINIMYILFPLTVYLIYTAYTKNLDLKEKSIMLELALYSSLYMLIRYGVMFKTIYPVLLFNIPLLISYIKNKTTTSLIISLTLIIYNTYYLHLPFIIPLIEYILYFSAYILYTKLRLNEKKLANSFIIIRTMVIIYETLFYIIPSASNTEKIYYIVISCLIVFSIFHLILMIFSKSENILNYNSALNELNREKEIRASLFKITHEVKNPLAVCRGYLDMLENEEKTEKKYKEYLPIISSEINKTLTLMDDFLDYTKIKISKEDTDLYLLLEEIEEELTPLLKKQNIITEFNIPDDEVYLDLDYTRIKQVFINIYKNSIEAKKENMKITLNTYKKNNSIIIKVSDNGIGMTKETLSHIGENFYTTKSNGTGLGVSLSKEIITLHGGKMYYKSIYGKGTDVFIELPTN